MTITKFSTLLLILTIFSTMSEAFGFSQIKLQASAGCLSCIQGQSSTGHNSIRSLAQQVNIFVQDNRINQKQAGEDHSFAAIGRLTSTHAISMKDEHNQIVKGISNGQGPMLSPCHLITSKHVVFGDAVPSRIGYSMNVQIGDDGNGNPKYNKPADPVLWGEGSGPEDDWALLQVHPCVGADDSIGWMTAGSLNSNLPITIAGYQHEKFAGLWSASGGHVRAKGQNSTFLHDCPSREGASGAPLFYRVAGVPVLMGINSGEIRGSSEILKSYDSQHANTGIAMEGINEKIQFELQRGFEWFAKNRPNQENPQIAMAKQNGKTQLAQNGI